MAKEERKSKLRKKKKINDKVSEPKTLTASEAAAIVAASSKVTNVSMTWLERIKHQRLRCEHPDVVGMKELFEKEKMKEQISNAEFENKKIRLTDKVNDSDINDTISTSVPKNNQLSAVEWANSLFTPSTLTSPSFSTPVPSNTVLAMLRRRPTNFKMVPDVYLNFEPFWRTEPLEEIEATWKIERPDLVETFLSKHKAATRASKKKLALSEIKSYQQ